MLMFFLYIYWLGGGCTTHLVAYSQSNYQWDTFSIHYYPAQEMQLQIVNDVIYLSFLRIAALNFVRKDRLLR